MPDNYILFDGPGAEEFAASLESHTRMDWRSLSCDGRASVSKWRRIVNYFLFPLGFYLGKRNVGKVVAWQQFYGITVAFYNSFLNLQKGIDLTVMTFIYKPKSGLSGKIYHRYVDRAISSDTVSRIVVFSRSEVERYSRLFPKAAHKFVYVPLGIPALPESIRPVKGDYIFTAGMSNRDYGFMCDALKDTSYKVRIACPGVSVPDGATNIEVLDNCHGEDMLREMAGCRLVVIPLRDHTISSGQLVLLQAMQLGKPVVVTRTETLSEYVEDGRTAMFIDNEKSQLLKAVERLYNDDSLYGQISTQAQKKAAEEFSHRSLGANMAKLIGG